MTSTETPIESAGMKSLPVTTLAAAAFFAVILILTGYFAYRNSSLDSEIESEKKRSAEYETSIVALKRDPSVQAAEILARAKPEIEKNIETSTASKYIRELDKLHKDYLVQFNGFAFQEGRITTSVIADKWLADDAIRKVIKLIGDYRSGTLAGSLSLSPVSGVNGDAEKRSFGVEYKIK